MAMAGIIGAPAMPKGSRHGSGVSAFQSDVPPHLVRRWLGHAFTADDVYMWRRYWCRRTGIAARMWASRLK
jgi:integrase/recombinase XerD